MGVRVGGRHRRGNVGLRTQNPARRGAGPAADHRPPYDDPVPTTSPGARGTDPFDQARHAARELGRRCGVDHHDVVVVLGTGLAPVAPLLGAADPPVELSALPWFPRFTGLGHRPEAWSLEIEGRRVLVMAGRTHLYEGGTPAELVHPIRTALATGCRTVILTCSAGAIRPDLSVGDVVAVADHLNLTATSPLIGIPSDHAVGPPYVDLTDTWSPRLRALAHGSDSSLPEGVYAQMVGPNLETPAEIGMLAVLGADLVGMSIVPEAIAARHLGAEVLGLAVVTNAAAGLGSGSLSAGEITRAAGRAVDRVAQITRSVIVGVDQTPDAPGDPAGPPGD